MSRWGRGRGGSVAVPLDSALFRENSSNCPSAARSAGTVGKWGITSFTSIRSAPYAFSNNVVKKPVQDQNSPLTVPAVETEQPPPKPKKFFKSRNAEPYPPTPQITYAPPSTAAPLSPEHPSNSKDSKKTNKRNKHHARDSESPEAVRFEKTKSRKNSVITKAAKKEDVTSDSSKPPNKRYLVRNRSKIINYAEDGSNSPIPDFTHYETQHSKAPSPKPSPSVSSLAEETTPIQSKPDIVSPLPEEPSEERKPPPIVLRISKGTSRIVSTDSNEGFTSPSSDRNSSLDMHPDMSTDIKASPSSSSICSPRQESLKITIKCPVLDKKEKKKDKKEHKSHKRHHRGSDDEPLKKSSPVPSSDTYELYKTLASPVHSNKKDKGKPVIEDIESQLAELDSIEPTTKSSRLRSESITKSSRLRSEPTQPPPEPKPPESSRGRSRRNRPNINYNENDNDYIEALTNRHSSRQTQKVIPEPKKETRKSRRRNETLATITSPLNNGLEPEIESQDEKSDLINILSDDRQIDSEDSVHKESDQYSQKSPVESNLETPSSTISDSKQIDYNEENNLLRNDDNQASSQSPKACNVSKENLDEEFDKPEDTFKPPQVSSVEQIEDKPCVKLVITKKKGSIFKSKSLMSDNPSPLPARKRRHLYKHEWNDKGNETPRSEPEQNNMNTQAGHATTTVPEELTRVTRYRSPDPIVDDLTDAVKPYTSVKCAKEAKEYYTVVRNVKKAHQIQEIGEYQEFNDDVDYLLDALQDNNPISTRCLSAITLASKCTAPAFRMHLRAHGTVQKFFSALHDATNDQSLGLCTATVMFVLSQDRLNMDLDRESLELMLNLLESDVSHKNALEDCGMTSAQLVKTQERVRELCAEIKNQGKAKHLDLENITVGHLAMETLLSLTSKRAGEWFKEELRVLGGVDHILRTIQECTRRLLPPASVWSEQHHDLLRKADRCMRVLENVTQQNEENQLYLVSGERIDAVPTLASLLGMCINEARTGKAMHLNSALLDAALPAIKVLVNLSHSFGLTASEGADVVGKEDSVMEICLVILNNQGNFVPDDRNFEFSVCVLLLLINLVQNNEVNTERLLNIHIRVDNDDDIMAARVPALDLIVNIFYKREELAKQAEENTDAILDGDKESEKKQSQDDIDETVAKLLSRAGTHMEHTMVGAYLALVVGQMAASCEKAGLQVKSLVPRYAPLLPTLHKYYKFLSLTASAEPTIVAHVKATHRIIKFMETSDQEPADATQPAYSPPSDVPQDMSINNLTYNSYSSSSSDRMSSSMDIDGYQ